MDEGKEIMEMARAEGERAAAEALDAGRPAGPPTQWSAIERWKGVAGEV